MDADREVLLDTCVLINFAAVGRIQLLGEMAGHSFFITEHVRDEVKSHFTAQFDAVNDALAQGFLTELVVDAPEELADFASLAAQRNLGNGECSAIAAAKHRSLVLAIDDRRARNKAVAFHSQLELLSTVDLMIILIRQQVLSVEEADVIKAEWEEHHSFRLPFQSFAERVQQADHN